MLKEILISKSFKVEGNGLYFKENIKSVTIPREDWITAEKVFKLFQKEVPLSFYYLDLKFNHPNSEYYKILPKYLNSPLLWKTDSIEYLLLESTGMLVQVEQKKKHLLKEFEKWFIELIAWFPSITFEEFLWADQLVKSRSMEVPIIEKCDEFEEGSLTNTEQSSDLATESEDTPTKQKIENALGEQPEKQQKFEVVVVPWIDVANHSLNPNAAWKVTKDGMTLFLLDTLGDIGFESLAISKSLEQSNIDKPESITGREIMISYGLDKGNQTLFFAYHFTLKNNPVKQLLFPIVAWEDENLDSITMKRNLLREWGIAEKFEIFDDELTADSTVVLLLSMSPGIVEFLDNFMLEKNLESRLQSKLKDSFNESNTNEKELITIGKGFEKFAETKADQAAATDKMTVATTDSRSFPNPNDIVEWLKSIKMYEVTLLRGLYILQEQMVNLLNGCQQELDEDIEINSNIFTMLNLRETNVRDLSSFLPILEQRIEKLASLPIVQQFLSLQS